MRKFMKSKKGFTLVELLIVVVILGILAAVAIPRFVTTKDESQKQACRSNLASMQSVYEELLFNNATADMAAIQAKYPQGAPTCPAGGNYTISGGKIVCDKSGHSITGT